MSHYHTAYDDCEREKEVHKSEEKEAGLIYCNGTTEEYDEMYGCRLHLPHEHWHRVLDIDGKGVIEWERCTNPEVELPS